MGNSTILPPRSVTPQITTLRFQDGTTWDCLPEVNFSYRGLWERDYSRPRLIEDAISPVSPSCREREYFPLILTEETTLSTFCSEILTGIFIEMAVFVITVYNSHEKWTKIENIHCLSVCLFFRYRGELSRGS